MWDKIVSLIDSLIIHVILLAILFVSVEWPKSVHLEKNPPKNAVAVDEKQVQMELERLKKEEAFKNLSQQMQAYTIKQKKLEYQQSISQEQKNLDTLRQQQREEKLRLEVLKQRIQSEEMALKNLEQEKAKMTIPH